MVLNVISIIFGFKHHECYNRVNVSSYSCRVHNLQTSAFDTLLKTMVFNTVVLELSKGLILHEAVPEFSLAKS